MKVACYIRVSTDDQSTDMQRRDLEKFCELHNFEPVFYEDFYSGDKRSRPRLNDLLNDCRLRKFAKVIVWKFDRLSRSVRDFLNIFHELEEVGVAIVSFKDGLDPSTPMGKAMMQVMAILSELELHGIRERTKAGLSAAKARGVRLGKEPRPFDFEAYQKLRSRGLGNVSIARRMGFSQAQLYRRIKLGV